MKNQKISFNLRVLLLWLGILAAFMVLIDTTIVDVALPYIARDFHASQADVEWVVNAYTLSFAAVMLGAGAFADAIGAKKVFICGILIFSLSSATCAGADSIMFLNISRFIQGIGAIFNFAYFGLLFGLSFFLQKQLHLDAWHAGLAFIPLNGVGFVTSMQVSKISQRLGRLRVLMIGQIGMALSLGGAAYIGYYMHFIGLLICMGFIGFFAGLVVPTLTSQILSTVDNALHGATSATFNTARQIGGAIGVAAYGPLLAAGKDLRFGFMFCMLMGSAATIISAILTKTTQRTVLESDRIRIHNPAMATEISS